MDCGQLYLFLLITLSGTVVIHGVVVTYQDYQHGFRNPDRGFYIHTDTHTSNFIHLTDYQLKVYRDTQVSLVFRMYILDTFLTSDLSSSFLANLTSDLSKIKAAGISCVLRFCYSNSNHLVPGARDASKYWMLRHIQSLASVVDTYSDVISVMQAGFIGVWGEWFYTDHFGDITSDTGNLGLTDQEWQDRTDVVNELLNSMPPDIPILVRTPYYKAKVLGTWTAATFTDVTSGNNKGRIGHHNDCFLRTSNDLGTYRNEVVERPYVQLETLVVPSGGETCGLSTENGISTDRSKCPTALQELSDYHFSFLNIGYHPDVIQDWKDDDCFQVVAEKLGYSLRLTQADLPTSVASGGVLQYSLTISNTGWAAPYRLYKVLLVLSSTTGSYYSATLPSDPRSWTSSSHVLQGNVKVDSSIAAGSYEMYLGVVQDGLSNRADYYLLFHNAGVPRPVTGLNSLLHTLTVVGTDVTTATLPTLTAWTPPPDSGLRACMKVEIPNFSFETQSDWFNYDQGWTSDSSQTQEGSKSARVLDGGAYQMFQFSRPVRKMMLIGHSKIVNGPSSINVPADYSLYCDLQIASNTMLWGYNQPFSVGNNAWQSVTLYIDVSQDIKMATCYVLYRNQNQGEAYFDNISAFTLSSDVTSSSQCAHA